MVVAADVAMVVAVAMAVVGSTWAVVAVHSMEAADAEASALEAAVAEVAAAVAAAAAVVGESVYGHGHLAGAGASLNLRPRWLLSRRSQSHG